MESKLAVLARGDLRDILTSGYQAWLVKNGIADLSNDRLTLVDERFRAGFVSGYLGLGPTGAMDIEMAAFEAGFALGMTQ